MTEEDYDGMLGGPSTVASICARARGLIYSSTPLLYPLALHPLREVTAWEGHLMCRWQQLSLSLTKDGSLVLANAGICSKSGRCAR
eukprot:1017164-Prymnesium_polylepis.1